VTKNRGQKRREQSLEKHRRNQIAGYPCPIHKHRLIWTPGDKYVCTVLGCDIAQFRGSLPADGPTRNARHSCHLMFDPLWKADKFESRVKAYEWLAQVMNLSSADAHIGFFTLDQCHKLMEIIGKLFKVQL
jgi:hypothetical protein